MRNYGFKQGNIVDLLKTALVLPSASSFKFISTDISELEDAGSSQISLGLHL